jgi:hypothetical protein
MVVDSVLLSSWVRVGSRTTQIIADIAIGVALGTNSQNGNVITFGHQTNEYLLRQHLVAMRYRTHKETTYMSEGDMRNCLIVEINNAGRSNGRLPSLSNGELIKIDNPHPLRTHLWIKQYRTAAELSTMSQGDMRNCLICEIAKAGRGDRQLPSYSNAKLLEMDMDI